MFSRKSNNNLSKIETFYYTTNIYHFKIELLNKLYLKLYFLRPFGDTLKFIILQFIGFFSFCNKLFIPKFIQA